MSEERTGIHVRGGVTHDLQPVVEMLIQRQNGVDIPIRVSAEDAISVGRALTQAGERILSDAAWAQFLKRNGASPEMIRVAIGEASEIREGGPVPQGPDPEPAVPSRHVPPAGEDETHDEL